MTAINILSLVQAYYSLEEEGYINFLHHYDIDIKNEEVEDLSRLVNTSDLQAGQYIFNDYFVGYKIPQIGKEFDLLRIGLHYIVNIELKSSSSEEKIKKQLLRNKYYLSFIGKPIYNFAFVSGSMQMYFLNNNNDIQLIDFKYLKQILDNQYLDSTDSIDKLFNPSVYLVSPFNSTERFINDEYFLTHQQEEIRKGVLNATANTSQPSFISITGKAGTGKTLLVYDIAKEILTTHMKVLIIHCGKLNEGQNRLTQQYKWEVIPIKSYKYYNLASYNIVIIDEAQRIKTEQLNIIVSTLQASNSTCIFSYDKKQTLAHWEEQRNIDAHINAIDSLVKHELTDKIRTNKAIASFIVALFDKKKCSNYDNRENIELNYFSSIDGAKMFLESLDEQSWEVIRFTPSQYNNEYHNQYASYDKKNSHSVIGQEFENVVVVIDQFFSYSDDGKLTYKTGCYYDPVKMLFQNITRTIKKLNIIILNNTELLDRCISIMKA